MIEKLLMFYFENLKIYATRESDCLTKPQTSFSFQMDYLIRFVQIHENFRRPEIEALAVVAQTNLELVDYTELVRRFFLIRDGVDEELTVKLDDHP